MPWIQLSAYQCQQKLPPLPEISANKCHRSVPKSPSQKCRQSGPTIDASQCWQFVLPINVQHCCPPVPPICAHQCHLSAWPSLRQGKRGSCPGPRHCCGAQSSCLILANYPSLNSLVPWSFSPVLCRVMISQHEVLLLMLPSSALLCTDDSPADPVFTCK